MRNVAGLSTSDAQKSSDMFAKCRYMDEITGNRGVIFATGTPVSNSMYGQGPFGAVSYTHLDVYKRQVLEKPDICPACQRSKAMVSRRRPAA